MSETEESITDTLSEVLREASEPEADVESVEEQDGILEAEAEEAIEQDVEASEEDSDESDEPEKVFEAPEHWSSDERSQFDALSPEAQEILISRDKAFQTGYQEKAQSIADVRAALEPWKDEIVRAGLTEDQAIRQLFALYSGVQNDPLNGILGMARNFGVLDQLQSQFAPADDTDDFADPEVKALRNKLSQLEGQLGQTQQGIQEQQQSALQQQVSTFKSETDAKGNLAHPHFDKVSSVMAAYVQQGKSLSEAYESAVWTIPEYRDSIKPAAPTAQEKAAKVKKAKRAARAVTTNGKAKPGSDDEPLSLGDDLRLSFKQLS